jgi:hypothetical protein
MCADSEDHPGNPGGNDRHTRSRVSFFMNRFRQLGCIEYNGGIQVHKSLLNLILHY